MRVCPSCGGENSDRALFCQTCAASLVAEAVPAREVRKTVTVLLSDVMAVFSIPTLHEDDALRACRAAIEIKDAIDRLNGELERDWGVTIATRTGPYTGEVIARDPSSGQALVTGDAVNAAARLDQAAPPGQVLIGRPTYRLVASLPGRSRAAVGSPCGGGCAEARDA